MPKVRTPPIYTTPTDAATAFYEAFEAKDVEAMMATWADDEEIVCVHPGGTRLVGYDAVRSGWEQLFAGDARLTFRLDQVVIIETVGLAMQSAVEHVSLEELLAVAGVNLAAIPIVAICAVFARGYVRGLTAAMIEGA